MTEYTSRGLQVRDGSVTLNRHVYSLHDCAAHLYAEKVRIQFKIKITTDCKGTVFTILYAISTQTTALNMQTSAIMVSNITKKQ